MSTPKLTARWQGREYNPALDEDGDLTFHYPDRAGGTVSRVLTDALTDDVLKQIKAAGYDLKTLRLSIRRSQ